MDDIFEIELQNKKYKGKKLNIADFAAFEDFVQERRSKNLIAVAKEMYGDKIPESIYDKAVSPPTKDELELEQQSLAGVTFLFWRTLKKCDESLTLEMVGELISIGDVPKLTKLIIPDVLEGIGKKNEIAESNSEPEKP